MKNEIALRPSYWASVSGGKDSLFMLKLILSNPKKYPLDGVVHFELEIDLFHVESALKRSGDFNKSQIELIIALLQYNYENTF